MESYWILFIVFFCIILPLLHEQRQTMQQIRMQQIKKRRKGAAHMSEALQCFVGKRCVIITASGAMGIDGDVKAVEGNWLTVLTGKKKEVKLVNTDYIVTISEHPNQK